MRNLLAFFQIILFVFFILTLTGAVSEVAPDKLSLSNFNHAAPEFNKREAYDPSLQRINSMAKLEFFCDSLYGNINSEKKSALDNHYPLLAADVIRNRFYHGFSYYGFGNNYLALVCDPLFPRKAMSAIVIPDDMLKYPNAACSQQSIVFMELLKRKGYPIRRIGFESPKGGHFCFEVLYNGSWHFYDPDYEPDADLLLKYDRPGIKFLQDHPEILAEAYRNKFSAAEVKILFSNYSYGKVNEFLAPYAYVYQTATKYLAFTIWLPFLFAFIFVRKKYLLLSKHHVWNNRLYFPYIQPKRSFGYYEGVEASRA